MNQVVVLNLESYLRAIEDILKTHGAVYEIGLYNKSNRYKVNLSTRKYFKYPCKLAGANEPGVANPELTFDELITLKDGEWIEDDQGDVIINTKMSPEYYPPNLPISPMNPIYAVKLLEDMIDVLMYDLNPYKELLIKDELDLDLPLIDEDIRIHNSVEDVIYGKLNYIPEDLQVKICGYYTDIILKDVIKFMNEKPEDLYVLESTMPYLRLKRLGDIRAIRYEQNVNERKSDG